MLALAAALALAGCTGGDDEADSSGDQGVADTSGPDTGVETAPAPVAPPTEAADIAPALGERSASGGTSITIEADQAGFVLPSGNIACSITAGGAVCQISDKTFTVDGQYLSATNLPSCTAADADAMRLASGRGAWTCVSEPVAGQAAVTAGGWWVEQVDGTVLTQDGQDLAVLPYGSSITLGPVTCASSEAGVTCSSGELGRSITLSRTSFAFG